MTTANTVKKLIKCCGCDRTIGVRKGDFVIVRHKGRAVIIDMRMVEDGAVTIVCNDEKCRYQNKIMKNA